MKEHAQDGLHLADPSVEDFRPGCGLDLAPVCHVVHMIADGAYDIYRVEDLELYVRFLSRRLERWYPARGATARYENAMRELCEAALEEARVVLAD